MHNPLTGARNSMALPISLGLLAMTLSAPAFAGDRKAADRGAKSPIVAQGPVQRSLPISTKQEVVGRELPMSVGKGVVGPWYHSLLVSVARTIYGGNVF